MTKGAVTHKSMYDEFFDPQYTNLRDAVDKAITGEDLLMSFVLSRKKGLKIKMVCLDVQHHCSVECRQNSVETLFDRSSEARKAMLRVLFER